jgi:hypothetical protein
MSYRTTDFQSEEGKSFPYVYLSESNTESIGAVNGSNKVRVYLQAAVHGNEPAGDQSLLALLGKMDANQTWTASLLERLDILVLPRYNPDGVEYFQRTLTTNFDPNRDHIKLARQQTRDLKQFFNSFAPHVAVDMHEYGASSTYGGSYKHASDGLFSAAKNLNIHPEIRRLSEEVFAENVGSAMEAADLRWEPYVTGSTNSTPGSTIAFAEAGSDGKIGRNAMGLTQSVTFLCEMRGIGIADQEFKRRTLAGLTMAEAIIQTAADNADEVYETIENSIDDFINGQDGIVVTDSSNTTNRPFSMVDINNGSVVQVPVEFSGTTPVTGNLTRERPEAYLIPQAWANLAERLRVFGLEVEELQNPFRGQVETYNITSAEFATGYYEGTVLVTATTEPKTTEVDLPAGSFLVSTRQKNAALAFVALEPENIDSFVAFNLLPVEVGDEYPIFKIMSF